MIVIKQCPFCKCHNPYVEYHFYMDTHGSSYDESWVACPVCEAQGPHESLPVGMSVQEAAIKAWNER